MIGLNSAVLMLALSSMSLNIVFSVLVGLPGLVDCLAGLSMKHFQMRLLQTSWFFHLKTNSLLPERYNLLQRT